MRSQFKPVAPATPSRSLSAPAIFALTARIQVWLTGLALLTVMSMLGLGVLASSFSELLTQIPAGEKPPFDPATFRNLFPFSLAGILLYGLLTLGLMWQVWQWMKGLTLNATAAAPARAQSLLTHAGRLLLWVRMLQLGPFLLLILSFLLSLVSLFVQRATPGTVKADPSDPGSLLGLALSALLNFLILDSVREWLRAVATNARGSKNLISPKLGKMGAWTLLWYLALGMNTLSALLGSLIFFTYPLDKLPFKDISAAQAGMFSRISGGLQGTMLMFFLINVTLLVLLTLLRRYADQVTTALDERSLQVRRQAQEERWSHAPPP